MTTAITNLTPEQKAWAQDVADSISRALKEVEEAEANGIELQSAEDFLTELRRKYDKSEMDSVTDAYIDSLVCD